MTKRRILRTVVFLAISMLWSCAGSSKESARPHAVAAKASLSGRARSMPPAPPPPPALEAQMDRYEDAIAVSEGAAVGSLAEFDGPPSAAPAGKPGSGQPAALTTRMIAYQGWLQLASLEPDALLDSAERRATTLDGYVESRRGRHLVLRVPVHRFEQLFQAVKLLGKVASSRKTAEDVTEAVESTDLELQLRRTQLAKLKSILQRETKINERASLLQEIRRVSEEIARLEARAGLLRKRVQLSTLEVDAIPLSTPIARKALPPPSMWWISRLFNDSHPGWLDAPTTALPLKSTPEFVPVTRGEENSSVWQAATVDGSLVSSYGLENRPNGNARFWREAILHYRGDGFSAPDTSTVEGWAVARLPPLMPDGTVWWVAVRTQGDRLHLVQARMSLSGDRQFGQPLRRMLQESKP